MILTLFPANFEIPSQELKTTAFFGKSCNDLAGINQENFLTAVEKMITKKS